MFCNIHTHKFLSVHESRTAFDQHYHEQTKLSNVIEMIYL